VQNNTDIKIGVGKQVWANVGDEWVVSVVVKINKPPKANAMNIGATEQYVVKHKQSRSTLTREQLVLCDSIPLGTTVRKAATEVDEAPDATSTQSLGRTLRLHDLQSTLHASDKVWVQLQRWSQGSVVAVQPQRGKMAAIDLLHEVAVNGKVVSIPRDHLFPVPRDAPPSESPKGAVGGDGLRLMQGATLLLSDFSAAAKCTEHSELAATASKADLKSTLEAGQRVWVRSTEWAQGVVLDVQCSRGQIAIQYSVLCEGQVYVKTRNQLRPLEQAHAAQPSAAENRRSGASPSLPGPAEVAHGSSQSHGGPVSDRQPDTSGAVESKQSKPDAPHSDVDKLQKPKREIPLVCTALHHEDPPEAELPHLPPASEQMAEDQHAFNHESHTVPEPVPLTEASSNDHVLHLASPQPVSGSDHHAQSVSELVSNHPAEKESPEAPGPAASEQKGSEGAGRPIGEAASAGSSSDEEFWDSDVQAPACAPISGQVQGSTGTLPSVSNSSSRSKRHSHLSCLRSLSPKRLPALIKAFDRSLVHGNSLNVSASLKAFITPDSKRPGLPQRHDLGQPMAESLGFGQAQPINESPSATAPSSMELGSVLKQGLANPEHEQVSGQLPEASGRSLDATSALLHDRFAVCTSVHNGIRTLEDSTRVSKLVLRKHDLSGWLKLESSGPVDVGLVPQDVCCVVIAELLLLPAQSSTWSSTLSQDLDISGAQRLGWTAFASFATLSPVSATICGSPQGGPLITGPGISPTGFPLISWRDLVVEACLQHGVKTLPAQSLEDRLLLYEANAPFRISVSLEGHGTVTVDVLDIPCEQSSAQHRSFEAARLTLIPSPAVAVRPFVQCLLCSAHLLLLLRCFFALL
jgi:hypothetical protein